MNLGRLIFGLLGLHQGVRTLREAFDDGEGKPEPRPSRRQIQAWMGPPTKARSGKMTMKTFQVSDLKDCKTAKERMKYIIPLIQKGRRDPKIREFAAKTLSQRCGNTWCTPEKDWKREVEVLFLALRQRYRYVHDTVDADLFMHPARTLEMGGGDCFPKGTLLLQDDYSLTTVENLRDGQRIWGLDRWSNVERVWYKGVLPLDAIRLNTGSWVHLTPDHKLYVAVCDRHTKRESSAPCSCPVSERRLERIRVADATPGVVLPRPQRLPFGRQTMDPDRAWIEGVYVADGWSERNSAFFISGQDGCPKEEQKRAVQAICERLGIPTRWNRKYIAVKDREWTLRLHQMGQYAPDKHLLSLGWDEAVVGNLVRGVMADSGAHSSGGTGRCFTTTSKLLATQLRVLFKMLGQDCGWMYVPDHGGLGTNPIWRLNVWGKEHKLGRNTKLTRIREIHRGIAEAPCWDITTDDHYVYLPEHDVTVSNCDDAVILLSSVLGSVGYKTRAAIIEVGYPNGDGGWHIYLEAEIPERGNSYWMPLDLSVDKPPGWSAPAHLVRQRCTFAIP